MNQQTSEVSNTLTFIRWLLSISTHQRADASRERNNNTKKGGNFLRKKKMLRWKKCAEFVGGKKEFSFGFRLRSSERTTSCAVNVVGPISCSSLSPFVGTYQQGRDKEGFYDFFFHCCCCQLLLFSTDILFLRSHFGTRRRCRGSCCRSRRHLFIVVDCKFYSEKKIKFAHSPFGRLNFFVVFIFCTSKWIF